MSSTNTPHSVFSKSKEHSEATNFLMASRQEATIGIARLKRSSVNKIINEKYIRLE